MGAIRHIMEKDIIATKWLKSNYHDLCKTVNKQDMPLDIFVQYVAWYFDESIEMQKKQMFDAWLNGANQGKDSSDSLETLRMKFELFEQYYNKTYGKETDRS